MTRHALILLLGLMGWCACEQPLEIDTELPAQLNIESQLEAGQSPRVQITALNTLGEQMAATGLERSFVTLSNSSSGDFILSPIIVADDFVVYEAAETQRIVSDLTYRLAIDAPGFAELRSTTTVPGVVDFGVPVTPIDINKDGASQGGAFEIPFTLPDVKQQANYYHLILTIVEEGDEATPTATRVPFRFTGAPSGTVSDGLAGLLFNDVSFTDQSASGTLQVQKSHLQDYFSPVLNLEVRNVSQAYFEFYRTRASRGSGRVPNPTSTTSANITNGAGYFGSFSSSSTRIELQF